MAVGQQLAFKRPDRQSFCCIFTLLCLPVVTLYVCVLVLSLWLRFAWLANGPEVVLLVNWKQLSGKLKTFWQSTSVHKLMLFCFSTLRSYVALLCLTIGFCSIFFWFLRHIISPLINGSVCIPYVVCSIICMKFFFHLFYKVA